MSDGHQFCTFHLDRYLFGIEVLKVQEVISYQHMTRVPLASSVLRGLINLRGQIVTAIDLRERLVLPPREGDALPMNVVVRTAGGAVSLLVDSIGDVVEVDEATFEPPPDTMHGEARELITGVYKFDEELLHVLDVARTIAIRADGTETLAEADDRAA